MGSKEIFVVTGEKSGDLNASGIIQNLKGMTDNLKVTAIGGDNLKKAGAEVIINYSEVNFIGFYSVVKNYFHIKSIMDKCIGYIRDNNPDVVLLVDFPGFNISFASKIRKFYKGKIIYYILPQLWAWHKSRIKKLKKYFDELLVVFPFEIEFYKRENLRVHYVGHPFCNRLTKLKESFGEKKSGTGSIVLMPGSRQEEFDKIYPTIIKAVSDIRKDTEISCTLIKTDNIIIRSTDIPDYIRIVSPETDEEKYRIIYNSDLVITKIGTASFECAILGTPFMPVYKASAVNYFIGKKMANIKFMTMINIIADKMIVKEFIQNDFTRENIFNEAMKILKDSIYRRKILDDINKALAVFSKTEIARTPEEIVMECLK
jgi:lipid-A-disaccharide synthase